MALDREIRIANAARRARRRQELALHYSKESGVMTIDEFAAFVRLSKETLYRRMRTAGNNFPTKYYPAGQPRYLRSEIEAWFAQQPA